MTIAAATSASLQAYTEEFLGPFAAASLMETDGAETPSSSWMIEVVMHGIFLACVFVFTSFKFLIFFLPLNLIHRDKRS